MGDIIPQEGGRGNVVPPEGDEIPLISHELD